MSLNFDYLIVGAGFAGAVLAERLASQCNASCLVIDKRNHIGGNAYDACAPSGVRLHHYGPHYFRTNSDRVVRYLSQFTEWRPVEYKILSWTDGRFWQFPITLTTFEQWIGRASSPAEMASTLAQWRLPIAQPANAEEMVTSQLGVRLYEKFFKNYTIKQWGRDPKQLDASICARIPVRTNRDDRYFSEKFQALPREGYTRLFCKLLTHRNIELRLGTEYQAIRPHVRCRHTIYTGPIDEYFGHCFGPLPYRSLRFEWETFEREFFQPVVQVNYPNDYRFTRIVEIKHATGQSIPLTTIVREYPESHGPGREAFYPVPARDSQARYRQYESMARLQTRVSFIGRLAAYRYYNMDQVVALALAEFERLRHRVVPASAAVLAPNQLGTAWRPTAPGP
jgi:UDP-galactopyranose mutase